jgi:hypothetical protein
LRSANDESQQAAIYQDMSTSSLVLDNTIDGTQVTLKGKGIQVNSTPAEASEALISGTVGKGSWSNWASRSRVVYQRPERKRREQYYQGRVPDRW